LENPFNSCFDQVRGTIFNSLLGSAVFTNNKSRADHIAREIEAGNAFVNGLA